MFSRYVLQTNKRSTCPLSLFWWAELHLAYKTEWAICLCQPSETNFLLSRTFYTWTRSNPRTLNLFLRLMSRCLKPSSAQSSSRACLPCPGFLLCSVGWPRHSCLQLACLLFGICLPAASYLLIGEAANTSAGAAFFFFFNCESLQRQHKQGAGEERDDSKHKRGGKHTRHQRKLDKDTLKHVKVKPDTGEGGVWSRDRGNVVLAILQQLHPFVYG